MLRKKLLAILAAALLLGAACHVQLACETTGGLIDILQKGGPGA